MAQDLDLPDKTELDFWDCSERENPFLIAGLIKVWAI